MFWWWGSGWGWVGGLVFGLFWIAVIALAVIAMGPSSLWWLIPVAWCTGGFGLLGYHHSHRRHNAHRPRELTPEDDLTLV